MKRSKFFRILDTIGIKHNAVEDLTLLTYRVKRDPDDRFIVTPLEVETLAHSLEKVLIELNSYRVNKRDIAMYKDNKDIFSKDVLNLEKRLKMRIK